MIEPGIRTPDTFRVAGFDRTPAELDELQAEFDKIDEIEREGQRQSRLIIVGSGTLAQARIEYHSESDGTQIEGEQ